MYTTQTPPLQAMRDDRNLSGQLEHDQAVIRVGGIGDLHPHALTSSPGFWVRARRGVFPGRPRRPSGPGDYHRPG